MPIGSYDLENGGANYGPLVALALSEVPALPCTFDDLLPYVLPYRGVSVDLLPFGGWFAGDPFLAYNSLVTFDHPPGVGPLSGAGVAIVWLSDPPVLSSQPVAVAPWTTPGAGHCVSIPLYRTILASAEES